LASLAAAHLLTLAHAGSFTANFNDAQVPANAQVFGNAVIESTGGVGDTGTLKLTKAINSQQGSFIVEDLDNGAVVYGFRISMMVRVGGGTQTPADGWSVSVAPDLPDTSFGEAGAGSGFTITFDTYDNVDGDPNNGVGEAPQISLRIGGQVVATSGLLPLTDMISGSQFVPVHLTVNADGSLDLDFNGKAIFAKLYFQNYQPLAGVRFGFGARTGGANENCFIDDLNIETFLTPLPGIAQQPTDVTVIEGSPARFSMVLNNGEGAAIQWLRNGTVVPGASDVAYTLLTTTAADDGARFSAKVSLGSTTLTSAEVTLKVIRLDLPPIPVLSFDFNDGATPLNTWASGTATVLPSGGVGDTGFLILTDAVNDQNGAFLIEDPHAGAPLYGIAARFDLRMGGGTTTPADGFSFNFATDLPEAGGDVEDGVGTGLSVTADVYDNGAGEAPSFSVKYGGVVLADRKVLVSAMQTGDGFADVILRLTPDGLIDLAWNGTVIFDRVPVSGFTSVAGGRIGLYARTGGLNEVHAVDNLRIYTYLTAETLRIARQPQSQTVLIGRSATFTVEANLTDATTYQWFQNGSPISGANESSFTTPPTTMADHGAKYKVEVKRHSQTVTSSEATLSVLDLSAPTNPQLSYDFNSGLPAGAQIAGTALIEPTGGVDDSGVLKLTQAVNSQVGSFRSALIQGGAQLLDFTIAVDVLAGGGTVPPADGFSINVGSDVPLTPPGEAENGAGTGITIAFDTYDNGGGEAPSIDVKYKGKLVVSKLVPPTLMNVADIYFQVLVRVKQDGTLDLAYGDAVIYRGLQVPGYVPPSGARVALYARTGGLNANYWFDNLRLEARLPQAITITSEPADALALVGQPATFTVQVSNPQGVSYQWLRGGGAIAGATQPTYTTPPVTLADEGAGFSVKVTGPGNTLTSRTALLRVMAAFDAGTNLPINLNFDDGFVPVGGALYGSAFLEDAVLKLTINENSQQGAFILDTPAGVSEIYDCTATWRMRVGGGTDVPADGFSFVLAEDIPDAAFGEDGIGSGLVVAFDIYDNGGGEAPAIDVRYKGEQVATRKLDISVLETGDSFVPVGVRINRVGTLDLYYSITAICRDLPLPRFTPLGMGRFGWGARTGGLNENHWLDDVRISLNTQPLPVEKPTFTKIGRNDDGTITLVWTGGGTLQQTTSLTPPIQWSDVPGAASPYSMNRTGTAQFFRVRR
jgi:hypothetical protein